MIEPIYRKLGRQLRGQREVNGLSQTDIADRLDVTRAAVSGMERGRVRIHLHLLDSWAKMLGWKLIWRRK